MWESQVRAEQGLRAGGIEEAFGSGDEGTQELGLCQRVPGGPPFRAHRRQAALNEEADMFTHRRLGQAHVLDQVADPVLTRGEVLHDRQPRRFRKCLEQVGVRFRRHLVEGCPLLLNHRHRAIISLYGDIVECDLSLDADASAPLGWHRDFAERHKLLQTHYVGAVPLDLLKSEQDRIGRQVAFLAPRIEASEVEYDQARAHLDDCLALAVDAHTIYVSLDDSLRRIANQAFFNRLVVTDGDVEGEPGVPFNIFFDPGVRATALARQGEGGNEAGKTGSVGGLNNDALVGRAGLEPATHGL